MLDHAREYAVRHALSPHARYSPTTCTHEHARVAESLPHVRYALIVILLHSRHLMWIIENIPESKDLASMLFS